MGPLPTQRQADPIPRVNPARLAVRELQAARETARCAACGGERDLQTGRPLRDRARDDEGEDAVAGCERGDVLVRERLLQTGERKVHGDALVGGELDLDEPGAELAARELD